MGFFSCDFDVVKTAVFSPLFKQFPETEMTWSQQIIVKKIGFQESELMRRSTLKSKSEKTKTNLTSVKKQRKLSIMTAFYFVYVCRR